MRRLRIIWRRVRRSGRLGRVRDFTHRRRGGACKHTPYGASVNPEVQRRAVIAAELAGKSLNPWVEEVLGRAAG